MYAPLLLENSKAVKNGSEEWETKVDGSIWKQKTFSYQAKCLNWIREEFNALADNDKKRVLKILADTGCELIL